MCGRQQCDAPLEVRADLAPAGRSEAARAELLGHHVLVPVPGLLRAARRIQAAEDDDEAPWQTLGAESHEALLADEIGASVAPPGVGKTMVGTYLVAERGYSTLVLVHRQPLLDQWLAQLSLFLGIDAKKIGQIGAGKRSANGRLDVAVIQSLVRSGRVADLVASYGQVVVDECYHVPAVSFERVLAEVRARYVVGLTATPQRRDGLHPIVEMQMGPTRFAVEPKSHAARRPFEHRLIVRETRFRLPTPTHHRPPRTNERGHA